MELSTDKPLELSEILAAAQRRMWPALLTLLLVVAITAACAALWPAKYTSTAIILVEPQEIPIDLVRSTITTSVDQRLQQIEARVMTVATLTNVINKFDLYPEVRKNRPLETVINRLRDDIVMEPVRREVVDPRSGRNIEALLAFSLSYSHRDPRLAQQVANELVSLYLNENLRARAALSEATSSFLSNEAAEMRKEILAREERLSKFKSENAAAMPEVAMLNSQMIARSDAELSEVRRQAQQLRQRRIYLDSELAQRRAIADELPDSVINRRTSDYEPAERLRQLRTQYLAAASSYSASHPDVIRLKREIAGLEQELGVNSDSADLQAEVTQLSGALSELSQRYSAEHPDVKRLQRSLEIKQQQLDEARRETGAEPANLKQRLERDPAYVQLRAQRESISLELNMLKEKETQLLDQVNILQSTMAAVPEVERVYRRMEQDLADAQRKYQDLKAKELEANVSASLEARRKGERFTIIEPPRVPEKPSSPNRLLIAMLGTVFAFGVGTGVGVLAEVLDDRIHGASGLRDLVGAQVLASIPVIHTRFDRRRGHRHKAVAVLGVLTVIVGGLALVHYYYLELPTLWFVLQRKLDILLAS